MKQAKWSWWAIAVAILVLTACSRDVGECWLPSEDGQGAGVGGGPIVPAGAGGFGDVPPEPQDAPDPPTPCDADDATELVDVRCGAADRGVECMIICAEKGHSCPAGVKHKKTNEMGKLYRCCGCDGDRQCWYTYSDGGICVLRRERPEPLTCL